MPGNFQFHHPQKVGTWDDKLMLLHPTYSMNGEILPMSWVFMLEERTEEWYLWCMMRQEKEDKGSMRTLLPPSQISWHSFVLHSA